MAEPTTPRPCLLICFEHDSHVTEAARTLSDSETIAYVLASAPRSPEEIERAIKAYDKAQTSLSEHMAALTGGEKALSILSAFCSLEYGRVRLRDKLTWTAFARVLNEEILIVELSGRPHLHPPKIVASYAP